MNDYQIIWEGVVHDSTGYARASRDSVLALDQLGVDVKVVPLNLGTKNAVLPMDVIERLQRLINKPFSNKKTAYVFHHPPNLCNVQAARKQYDAVLLNTLWETTKLPAAWANINAFDHIIVPSRWIADVMKANRVAPPITVAPFGTDGGIFHKVDEKMPLGFDHKFKFLSVGTWQHRKGFDALVAAYLNNFKSSDDVCLVIKTYVAPDDLANRGVRTAVRKFRSTFDSDAPIYLTTQDLTDVEMVTLYNACDAFVLPSRGEGVGLPYLEAMTRGLPVIATNYGGQEDFLNDQNSYLVHCTVSSVPLVRNPPGHLAPHNANLYGPGMMWGEPAVDALGAEMRAVYNSHGPDSEAAVKCASAKSDISQMTWANSAKAMRAAAESALGIS